MKHWEREAEQLCRDVIRLDSTLDDGKDDAPSLEKMAAQATKLLERFAPRRPSPSSKLKGPTRAQDREAKRATRRTTMASLRKEAMGRTLTSLLGDHVMGELSGMWVHVQKAQLLHLNGGNGRRTQRQSIENVCIDSAWANSDSDKNPGRWLQQVKAHCARYGYPLPPRWVAIEAKAEMNAGLAATAAKGERP